MDKEYKDKITPALDGKPTHMHGEILTCKFSSAMFILYSKYE